MSFTNPTPEEYPEGCYTSYIIGYKIRHYNSVRQTLGLFASGRLSPLEREHLIKMLDLVDGFLNTLWDLQGLGQDCIHNHQEGNGD